MTTKLFSASSGYSEGCQVQQSPGSRRVHVQRRGQGHEVCTLYNVLKFMTLYNVVKVMRYVT